MADETPAVDTATPATSPDTATLRKRVWWAVGGVVALWAVIYLTVVFTYVLGGPSTAGDAPNAADEPSAPGSQGGPARGPGPGTGN